jgi:RNA 2',3'-cyclic 3'-phosphodiesterase
MLRLFTGIEIPGSVRIRLSLLRAPIEGARWVDPDNMHITLRFVGEIDARTADDLASRLANIEVPRFTLSIRGVGAFGGREPRAIWAGVRADDALSMLQRANERAARAVGLAAALHAFKPHITLARLRGVRPAAVARFLEENGDLASEPLMVNRFVLFSARPGSGGAPYVVEEAYPLAGADGWGGVDS